MVYVLYAYIILLVYSIVVVVSAVVFLEVGLLRGNPSGSSPEKKPLRPAEDAPIKLIDLGHWKFQSGEAGEH